MKHLKTLRLASLAVMALAATVGIPSASAAEFHSAANVALEGVQANIHTFSVQGQDVTCNNVKFNGTASSNGTSNELNMLPEYNSCTAFGLPANINTAGCRFRFNANLNTIDLTSCTSGRMEIDSSNIFSHCHVNVPIQTGINNQNFANMNATGSNATLTEASNANNVRADINTSNGFCPLVVGTQNSVPYTGLTGIMGPVNAPEIHKN